MKLLALGDSIVWGQGHREADKFVTTVAATLGAEARSFAHSGAVIERTERDGAPADWGEVPEAAPSILSQVDAARQQVAADQIDVVLLDGGINDVSVFGLVVAVPWDPGGTMLRRRIDDVFGVAFPSLLRQVVDGFPKAVVVVAPYYPIVSEQTHPRQLVALMKHLPAPMDFTRRLDHVVEHLGDAALLAAIEVPRRAMIDQCAFFASRSRDLMSEAVAGLPVPGRAVLADLPWGAEHAFAAPATWVWSGSDDPLHGERIVRYTAHVLQNPFDWPLYTPIASLCHPNLLGEAAYANAILAALGRP